MEEEEFKFQIKKNLYDLEHDASLQRTHTIINMGAASILVLIAILATWLIEGGNSITVGFIFFSIGSFSYFVVLTILAYLPSKLERNRLLDTIESLKYPSIKKK